MILRQLQAAGFRLHSETMDERAGAFRVYHLTLDQHTGCQLGAFTSRGEAVAALRRLVWAITDAIAKDKTP